MSRAGALKALLFLALLAHLAAAQPLEGPPGAVAVIVSPRTASFDYYVVAGVIQGPGKTILCGSLASLGKYRVLIIDVGGGAEGLLLEEPAILLEACARAGEGALAFAGFSEDLGGVLGVLDLSSGEVSLVAVEGRPQGLALAGGKLYSVSLREGSGEAYLVEASLEGARIGGAAARPLICPSGLPAPGGEGAPAAVYGGVTALPGGELALRLGFPEGLLVIALYDPASGSLKGSFGLVHPVLRSPSSGMPIGERALALVTSSDLLVIRAEPDGPAALWTRLVLGQKASIGGLLGYSSGVLELSVLSGGQAMVLRVPPDSGEAVALSLRAGPGMTFTGLRLAGDSLVVGLRSESGEDVIVLGLGREPPANATITGLRGGEVLSVGQWAPITLTRPKPVTVREVKCEVGSPAALATEIREASLAKAPDTLVKAASLEVTVQPETPAGPPATTTDLTGQAPTEAPEPRVRALLPLAGMAMLIIVIAAIALLAARKGRRS